MAGPVAARKRLLFTRHAGWANPRRGGRGRGLIGGGGEFAVHQAFSGVAGYAPPRPSTTSVLDVDVTQLGEVDFVCGLYDDSDPTSPVAITVMIEVKNTRHWHYSHDLDPGGDLRRFLEKAAYVQWLRPNALVCPVFMVRRAHATLVEAAESDGFLVASTDVQVVLADHDILETPQHFEEVRDELGYTDLTLLRPPDGATSTNFHRGIISKLIPRRAREVALLWHDTHERYLPADATPF